MQNYDKITELIRIKNCFEEEMCDVYLENEELFLCKKNKKTERKNKIKINLKTLKKTYKPEESKNKIEIDENRNIIIFTEKNKIIIDKFSTLQNEVSHINSVCFCDEKNIIIVSLSSGIIELFWCENGKSIIEFKGSFCQKVCFSPDKNFMISWSWEKIMVWKINNFREFYIDKEPKILKLDLNLFELKNVVFSRDSKKIYSYDDKHKILEWDLETLKSVEILKEKMENFTITNCGDFLVLFKYNATEFFDIKKRKTIYTINRGFLNCLFFENNIILIWKYSVEILNIGFLDYRNQLLCFSKILNSDYSLSKDFYDNILYDRNLLSLIFDFIKLQ